jgi:hypothetical protein
VQATYANCFVPPAELRGRLLTDEISVAAAAPAEAKSLILDERIDPDRAQAVNVELWDRAYSWFRDGEHDPTLVDGISAGDIAGAEAALTILLPAARGVLEAQALREADNVEELTLAVATGGPGHYEQVERIQAEAFAAALGATRTPAVRRVVSRDPRNAALFAKFQRTRDPDWTAHESRLRVLARDLVVGATNVGSMLRDRPNALGVLEYNPTRAFARAYASDQRRALRLVRFDPEPGDLRNVFRAGDRAVILSVRTIGPRHAVTAPIDVSKGDSCVIGGVALAPVIGPHLEALVDRYASLISALAPRLREELTRSDVKALFVPFDTPPLARLLVRAAQTLGIASVHLNDGFKADDFQQEGMAADLALAWSESIRANYYRPRRRNAPVTGNPKADVKPRQLSRSTFRTRLVVGSFTFSPIDLNCRRSDPETFLAHVFEGIGMSSITRPRLTLKLHPADEIAHYAVILSRFAELEPVIVSNGDVVSLFDDADVYVTTYSTSLLEAVAVGLPVIYYRVNPQRLHPPFEGDHFLQKRTATSPAELAALLDEPPPEFETPQERLRWCERYVGPLDGRSVERVLSEIEKFAHVAVRT